MTYDRDILDTIATQMRAGAEPRDVLETLRGYVDPGLFMPDWRDVALALAVVRRRMAMRKVVALRGRAA